MDIQLGTENIDSINADIDIVLRYARPESSRLVSRKVADSSWVVCASPIYLERCGIPESPADLALHNCLSFSLRTIAVRWLFKSSPEAFGIEGNASPNHAPMLRELALRGVGIIRVADFVVANDIRSGTLIPLLSEFTSNLDEPISRSTSPADPNASMYSQSSCTENSRNDPGLLRLLGSFPRLRISSSSELRRAI